MKKLWKSPSVSLHRASAWRKKMPKGPWCWAIDSAFSPHIASQIGNSLIFKKMKDILWILKVGQKLSYLQVFNLWISNAAVIQIPSVISFINYSKSGLMLGASQLLQSLPGVEQTHPAEGLDSISSSIWRIIPTLLEAEFHPIDLGRTRIEAAPNQHQEEQRPQ